jgi:hypothetical protein
MELNLDNLIPLYNKLYPTKLAFLFNIDKDLCSVMTALNKCVYYLCPK